MSPSQYFFFQERYRTICHNLNILILYHLVCIKIWVFFPTKNMLAITLHIFMARKKEKDPTHDIT